MQLYLLRHGLAGQHGDPRFLNDADRPLTNKGRKKIEKQMAGLERFEIRPHLILSSPFARARETAEIVAQALGLRDRLVIDPALAAGASASAMLQAVQTHLPANLSESPDDVQVMIVGHEPDLSQAAAELSGGSAQIWLRKGGLIRIDIIALDNPHGVLRWLLEPEHLIAA